MTNRIRVVAPFFPLPAESVLHRSLPDFDWLLALRMLAWSVEERCRCPFHAVTDETADLPVPALRYRTHERRLMLWTLEACACYLESEAFDRDTVMLDVDQLVFRDLADVFPSEADLGLLMRPTTKHLDAGEPLLNGVQFWAVSAKDRLGPFYRQVLNRARTLPDDQLIWGADTVALREAVSPMVLGRSMRAGLRVACLPAQVILEPWSTEQILCLRDKGQLLGPSRTVLDFRYRRKQYMREVFAAAFGERAWKS